MNVINRTGTVLLMTLSLCLPVSTSFAKSIDLYDQPKNGKSIGTLDSEEGIIKIYTPKDSSWIKVADPRNGNVGWVKSTDLENMPVQMNLMSTTNNKGYQYIQVKTPAIPLNHIMQQQAYQMERMMRDFEANWFGFPGWINTPPVVPVFVLPVKDNTPSQNKK